MAFEIFVRRTFLLIRHSIERVAPSFPLGRPRAYEIRFIDAPFPAPRSAEKWRAKRSFRSG
jgi:hypothetical protein